MELNSFDPNDQKPGLVPGYNKRLLDLLGPLDQLFVKQKFELLEAFTGFETQNKYQVLNSSGQPLFYCKEDSECVDRMCCGPLREFNVHIFCLDEQEEREEVMSFHRPLACWPCCLQEINLTTAEGPIGSITQQWSWLKPIFAVNNAQGEQILKIKGPVWKASCCGSKVKFRILSTDGQTQIGEISKVWSGLASEYFTDRDNFYISFPADLDVNAKATLLAGCMLIDFMYYETKG